MAAWTAFPYDAAGYAYGEAALAAHWPRLHRGDAQPFPQDPAVRAAWALFHAGEFQRARDAGLAAGGAGVGVANKAQAVHANYLERRETARRAMFLEIVERAEAAVRADDRDVAAHYWLAYALGRYSQGISVAEALAQRLGLRVKRALETAIALEPAHIDARIALGAFHAEVIDRVGRTAGKAQGADAGAGLKMFKEAMALHPESAIAKVGYANGLMMIEGDRRRQDADRLYAEAAACEPRDAAERLDVEMAKAALEDE
jgi:hypothetical protein